MNDRCASCRARPGVRPNAALGEVCDHCHGVLQQRRRARINYIGLIVMGVVTVGFSLAFSGSTGANMTAPMLFGGFMLCVAAPFHYSKFKQCERLLEAPQEDGDE